MDSLKRILFVFVFFGVLLIGTLYLYQIDRGLALIFNMGCFGALCAFLAYGKQRSTVGWFCAGLFGGVLGLVLVLMVSPEEVALGG